MVWLAKPLFLFVLPWPGAGNGVDFAARLAHTAAFAFWESVMPINHFDMQRLAAVKLKDDIRKKGSPDRFGKDSNNGKSTGKGHPLLGQLLQQVKPQSK